MQGKHTMANQTLMWILHFTHHCGSGNIIHKLCKSTDMTSHIGHSGNRSLTTHVIFLRTLFKNGTKKQVITLYRSARCLQMPTERLPSGSSTQLRQSLSSLLTDFHLDISSPCSVEAAPLVNKSNPQGVKVTADRNRCLAFDYISINIR